MRSLIVSIVVAIMRLLIRLPDSIIIGLTNFLSPIVPAGDMKESISDINIIFKSGKPNTEIVRNMITKGRKSDLKMIVSGALFNVDILEYK